MQKIRSKDKNFWYYRIDPKIVTLEERKKHFNLKNLLIIPIKKI
jgi:hypothetical protein